MTLRRLLAATALACTLGVPAFAAPSLTGSINIVGSDTYDTATHTVTFIGNGSVISSTGSLSLLGLCNNCATQQNITYSPLTPVLNDDVVTQNGRTFDFDILSVFNLVESATSLSFDSNAILRLTGFADTPGTLFFSTQGPQGTVEVSFSSTLIPTPEPTGLAILGVGLLGLVVAKRPRGLVQSHSSSSTDLTDSATG